MVSQCILVIEETELSYKPSANRHLTHIAALIVILALGTFNGISSVKCLLQDKHLYLSLIHI